MFTIRNIILSLLVFGLMFSFSFTERPLNEGIISSVSLGPSVSFADDEDDDDDDVEAVSWATLNS